MQIPKPILECVRAAAKKYPDDIEQTTDAAIRAAKRLLRELWKEWRPEMEPDQWTKQAAGCAIL